MASTLIQRICRPDGPDQDKLAIHAVLGVAQEVILGNLPAAAMLASNGGWLTEDEKEDADFLIAKIGAGDYTLENVGRWLVLGERGIYPVATVESRLGLT